MNKFIRALLLILVFSSASIAAPLIAQPELKGAPEELREFLHPRKHMVSLSANAEKVAYSDKAFIGLQVTTERKKLSESIEANQVLRETLIKSLVNAGVSSKNINNAKFSSSPQYGWFGKEPDSYEVTNTVTIAVTDENTFLAVTKIADNHNEVKVASTRFEHTQKDQVKSELSKSIMDKILAQKDFYEKSLGVKLTAIAFREGEIFTRPMRQKAPARADRESLSKVMQISSTPETPTSFDEIEYKTTLYVDFEVSR